MAAINREQNLVPNTPDELWKEYLIGHREKAAKIPKVVEN
jgi:hypothetical protein